ncbi:MAG: carbohydrate ABC transporter permease [Ardenticatenia bacterium]|nr:carbohydrate ABC transporter permease [Ardenticatenia bacterium]
MATRNQTSRPAYASSVLRREARPFMIRATVTLFVFTLLMVFISPFGYMTVTSLKDRPMITEANAPIWPARASIYEYEGEEYPVMLVPDESGKMHEWALIEKGREESTFIDPQNVAAGPIPWTGKWRTLESTWVFSPVWENFSYVWDTINMPRLLWNTTLIAVVGLIGTVFSCTSVAYGFTRFRIPGKNILFMILISTMILPAFVTIVPTYILFQQIGWVGTMLPLMVPHFFANAYNVFLLRQFFLTIPREMDEAAMIDGAGPFRTLISVILPQAVPVLVAVGIFHFVWAWNDFLGPLLYLSTEADLQPIAIGIQRFNAQYSARPHMVQSAALLGLLLPLGLFFLAQRVFMRGIVFTGVEK